jgi:signal peptidase II
MRKLTRLILVATLLFGCVGCDQITKVAARAHLRDGPAISYLHDTFRLVYAENPGSFLSLGASLPKPMRTAIFQGGVSLLVLGLIASALFWRGLSGIHVSVLTLLGASGLGNLIDRLLYDGRVTDFLNLGIGSLRTGIFNIADVVGMVGAIMLLLHRSSTAPHNHSFQRAGER